jgi:uncharacterized SAM-binding protein YcdF (DUF218 family)
MNIEEITKYIFVDDKDPSADIALVFGTWVAWQESVEKTAYLYKKGLVRKIIVSGGPNKHSGYIEGDEMEKELEKLGVPAKDILIENKATSTLENVLFSREIIDREIGFENVGTIVAVVKNFHARRALMTLKKNMPPHVRLKASTYQLRKYDFDAENWHQSQLGRQKVQGELDKIEKYLKKGDIAEL